VIFYPIAGTIGLGNRFAFGVRDHIAKFCGIRFRDIGVLIPPILPFFIEIAGRPYNNVSTAVLHCHIKIGGIENLKPLNRLSQNLAQIIVSAI